MEMLPRKKQNKFEVYFSIYTVWVIMWIFRTFKLPKKINKQYLREKREKQKV